MQRWEYLKKQELLNAIDPLLNGAVGSWVP